MAPATVTELRPGSQQRNGAPPPPRRPLQPLPRPKALIGPYALFWFYIRWLRRHHVQELLACIGVAIAVALVLATNLAAGSVSGSSTQAVRTVAGPATLQLHARSPGGIGAGLLRTAQRLPGVKTAGSLLETTATLRSPNGRTATVDLAGAGTSLVFMDGLARTIPSTTLSAHGIGLSSRTAQLLAIGGPPRTRQGSVELYLRGRAVQMPISAVLGQETFGALSHTTVAVMQLAQLQRLMGLPGRVSRILVTPQPGQGGRVRAELTRLAHGRIDVASAGQDIGLLAQALRPADQASTLFATVSALLGVLLATAALLLSAPDRRRMIADLRLMGMRSSAIVEMFAFQALVLAVIACTIGILCGYLLSVSLLATSPHYLQEAFTLGRQTTLAGTAIAAALATGLGSCAIAMGLPLLDLRGLGLLAEMHRNPGMPGNGLPAGARRACNVGAVVLLIAASALFATWPSLALISCTLLALATVCAVPPALDAVIALGTRLARRESLTALPVALSSLQATSLRSFALAATGALALFGSIALGGARGDLAHGIAGFAHAYASDATVWVGNRGDDQAVLDFPAGALPRRIAALPGVSHVAAFSGSFAVMDGRRVWIIARPPGAARQVLASQIVAGSAALAQRRLAHGGWAVVSRQIAEQQHVGIGGRLAVPTPSGSVTLRIAALSSNMAWSPGALTIGAAQYARLWGGHGQATALGVSLAPGASAPAVARRIRRLLGHGSGLIVRSSAALQASIDALTGEGLQQLREISDLLLAAAILAMTAALSSAVWQRRGALAGLRLCGVHPGRLRRILMLEAGMLLTAGCATGALTGLYGQAIIDRYLTRVTGFPVAQIATDARPAEILAVAVIVVAAAMCVPIVAASRVSPARALSG